MTTQLITAAEAVLDELIDLYDGAPDSPTRWMSHHIAALTLALHGKPEQLSLEQARLVLAANGDEQERAAWDAANEGDRYE